MLYLLIPLWLFLYCFLFFAPLWLAIQYERKEREVSVTGDHYSAPKRCWFLTIRGISISLLALVISAALILLIAYFAEREGNIISVRRKYEIVLFISFGTGGFWFLYTLGSLIQRNVYFDFCSDKIKFDMGTGETVIYLNEIEKIETMRKKLIIYVKAGEKTVIEEKLINRVIGGRELKKRLETLVH